MKSYDAKTAREKLREAGFTESFFLWTDYGEIGHIIEAYHQAERGVSTASLDAAGDQRNLDEKIALIAIMGGVIADRLMTGPAFDPATGYSDESMLDQLEKNGFLDPSQRQALEARLGQGLGSTGNVTGKFVDTTTDTMTKRERQVVDDLVGQGKMVERIPKNPDTRTPDFKIDGVKTELKTLENPNTNTGMKHIREAFKQGAETVIIDARSSGLTKELADEIVSRAKGIYPDKALPGKVEIWMEGQVITYP